MFVFYLHATGILLSIPLNRGPVFQAEKRGDLHHDLHETSWV